MPTNDYDYKETSYIDMLFLELSQFTKAKTAKEIELEAEISRLNYDYQLL
jgi:hypothetical protein